MKKQMMLDDLERERLARLRAEWQLAAAQADLARMRFEQVAAEVARHYAVGPSFDLDLDTGVIAFSQPDQPKKED